MAIIPNCLTVFFCVVLERKLTQLHADKAGCTCPPSRCQVVQLGTARAGSNGRLHLASVCGGEPHLRRLPISCLDPPASIPHSSQRDLGFHKQNEADGVPLYFRLSFPRLAVSHIPGLCQVFEILFLPSETKLKSLQLDLLNILSKQITPMTKQCFLHA